MTRPIFSLSTSLKCSLRCSYCTSGFNNPRAQKRETILDDLGLCRYLELVERLPIPDDALVNFHGPAEPTMLSGFVELARALVTEDRAVRVYTNLLKPQPIIDLVETAVPRWRRQDVEVAVSYHIGTYSMRLGDRVKVREALYEVLKRGPFVRLMLPATPAALWDRQLGTDVRWFREVAIGRFVVSVIVLGGKLDGQIYPEAYTDRELARLYDLSEIYEPWSTLPVYPPNLRRVGGPLRLEGQPCLYPSRHAAVGIDGRIWNCGPDHEPERRLGDPIESLYPEGAVPCPHPVCTCKPRGVEYCLEARGISLEEHYGLPTDVPPENEPLVR